MDDGRRNSAAAAESSEAIICNGFTRNLRGVKGDMTYNLHFPDSFREFSAGISHQNRVNSNLSRRIDGPSGS